MSADPIRVCVTGATGFVAAELIRQLLHEGYFVHATVRDLGKREKYEHLLMFEHAEHIKFYVADLGEEGSFDEAVEGCSYVYHLASPVFWNASDPQKELVDPSVYGTLNLLGSCEKEKKLKKVLFTSSIAAMLGERKEGHIYTEADWNDTATLETAPYQVAKMEAEQAAMKFVEEGKKENRINWDLVSVCPGLVIGKWHSNSKEMGFSMNFLQQFFVGKYPDIPFEVTAYVDVMDLAKVMIGLVENENHVGRFFVGDITATFGKLLSDMKKWFPDYPIASAPPNQKLTWTVDNSKVKNALNFEFRDLKLTLKDCMDSFIRLGLVEEPQNC